MSWKQAASLLVIVFVLALLQATLADPIIQLQQSLTGVADLSNAYFNGEQQIRGMVDSWFDMGLVALFLVLGVALARALRRELTQRRQP